MSLIEGIGDEVTVGVSIFVLLCLVLLAWFSTHTRDIPFVSIIVVELSQRRGRHNVGDIASSSSSSSESSATVIPPTDSETAVNNNPGSGDARNLPNNSANNSAENAADDPTKASTSNDGDLSNPPQDANSPAATPDADSALPTLQDANSAPTPHPSPSRPQEARNANLPDILSSNSTGFVHSEQQQQQTDNVCAASGSSPPGAQLPTETVPKSQSDISKTQVAQTSDEVRRRRVAYFDSTRDKGSTEIKNGNAKDGERRGSDVSSLGAETERSSVGAGSLNEHGGSVPSGAGGSSGMGSNTEGAKNEGGDTIPGLITNNEIEKTSERETATSQAQNQTPVPSLSPENVLASAFALPAQNLASDSSFFPDTVRDGEQASTSAAPETVGDKSQTSTQHSLPDDGVDAEAGTSAERDSNASGQQIRVRLKYLNDTQRLVYADPLETIGSFRRVHFSSELEENKIVRFIFNGQDLRNDLQTLRSYNVGDNSVIHCLITQNRQNEQANPQHTDDDDLQMGEFLYPVFGLILGLVWYLRFSYKHYFTAMSTVSLVGVSFIYLLALFSSMRHRRQPHQHLD